LDAAMTTKKREKMSKRHLLCCLTLSGILVPLAGCSKHEASAPVAVSAPTDTNTPVNAVPGPVPTPEAPKILTSTNNIDAVLAQLTRELHRTMIQRKLSGSFDEFVALSHVEVPPPPPGKKYAISKKWRIVLVDN
jgi:hypothetical protein